MLFKHLRGPHVAEAYLLPLILIASVGHALMPALRLHTVRSSQVAAVVETLSSGEIPAVNQGRQPEELELSLRGFLTRHPAVVQKVTGSVKEFAFAALGAVFLVPVLAIFFLSDGKKLAGDAIELVSTPETHRTIRELADDLHTMLQHYIKAKVTLGGLSFAYCSVALLILRFPHALVLGSLAGILEFVPVAGWMSSLATMVVVGILTHSHWIRAMGLYGVWRVLIDYCIAPRVLGRELEVHPLLAIFTTMVGGAIGGIVGIYLSIPLMAALRVIWHRLAVGKASTGSERDLSMAVAGRA